MEDAYAASVCILDNGKVMQLVWPTKKDEQGNFDPGVLGFDAKSMMRRMTERVLAQEFALYDRQKGLTVMGEKVEPPSHCTEQHSFPNGAPVLIYNIPVP